MFTVYRSTQSSPCPWTHSVYRRSCAEMRKFHVQFDLLTLDDAVSICTGLCYFHQSVYDKAVLVKLLLLLAYVTTWSVCYFSFIVNHSNRNFRFPFSLTKYVLCHQIHTDFLHDISRESKKKQDSLLLSITLPYVDRFSVFFSPSDSAVNV